MSKKYVLLLFAIFFFQSAILCQVPERQPDGGGDYRQLVSIKDEINPAQRASIINMLKVNEQTLRHEGAANAGRRGSGDQRAAFQPGTTP